jgi:hypothetical protein
MVRALKDRLITWFETGCAICLVARLIIMWLLKIGYTLALIAGLYVIFVWTFENEVPWEILGVKVLTPVVVPGEEFKMLLDIKKTRNCQGSVTRSLGGACGNTDITTVPTTLGIGRIDYEVHIRVPENIPDGAICIARIRTEYSCNIWQQIFPASFTLPEVPFTVRKLTPFIENGPGFVGPR